MNPVFQTACAHGHVNTICSVCNTATNDVNNNVTRMRNQIAVKREQIAREKEQIARKKQQVALSKEETNHEMERVRAHETAVRAREQVIRTSEQTIRDQEQGVRNIEQEIRQLEQDIRQLNHRQPQAAHTAGTQVLTLGYYNPATQQLIQRPTETRIARFSDPWTQFMNGFPSEIRNSIMNRPDILGLPPNYDDSPSTSDPAEILTEDNTCALCEEKRASVLCSPCGHLMGCVTCTRRYISTAPQRICPTCRTAVSVFQYARKK